MYVKINSQSKEIYTTENQVYMFNAIPCVAWTKYRLGIIMAAGPVAAGRAGTPGVLQQGCILTTKSI